MSETFITVLVEDIKNKTTELLKSEISSEEFEKQNKQNHDEFLDRMNMITKMSLMTLMMRQMDEEMKKIMCNSQRREQFRKAPVSPLYKKPNMTREIIVVPMEEQCIIPGCDRKKLKDKTLCKFHKCDKCDKRTHAKHGIFCKDCDTHA